MRQRTGSFTFQLDPEVRKAIERLAADERRSLAAQLNKIAADAAVAAGYLPARERPEPRAA
jgi:hypothetical protein